MNLGLGNLIELKRYVLAGSLVSGTDYDAALTAIGKGVAAQFDEYCNRGFERVAGAVDEFSGDRRVWIARRFPIETISAVAIKDDEATGFVAQTVNDIIMNRDDKAGVLKFGGMPGSHVTQVKVTYTGGYWFDTSEDASGVMPATATLLPASVKQAWFTQCAECWNKKDKLGTGITGNEPATFVAQMLASLELVPLVKRILDRNVRYAS